MAKQAMKCLSRRTCAHVYLLADVSIVLYVDDEDVVDGGGHDGGDGGDEAVVERRQERRRVDVLQAHRDAVVEHVAGDETHEQTRRRAHLVNAVYNTHGYC